MRHHRTQQTSKHKKIKAIDPFYSGPRKDNLFRAEKHANKAPVSEVGAQEIPRKVREMIAAKQKAGMKDSSKTSKKHQKFKRDKASIPEFKKGRYETLQHFYRRMDKSAQEAITKAELEVQFDVTFERKGKNKLVVSKKTDPGSAAKVDTGSLNTITKSQKRKAKTQKKRDDKVEESRDDFAAMKDPVMFGETAQAPPTMRSAPRKAPQIKKFSEKNLLLKSVLEPQPEVLEPPQKRSLFDDVRVVSRAKIVSARQEEMRQNAVDAYRLLKKQRQTKPAKVREDEEY